jgi:2-keto-4-pentenoate hydratase/2-oxohepta-3-ene-1,7-dioic acid hydratase in catechol pathway
MRLVTYRRGRGRERLGAVVDGPSGAVVIDLVMAAGDLARERGTVRRGRGGAPATMLALIQAGTEGLALARQAEAHGRGRLERDGVDGLTAAKLGWPLGKVRLRAPLPRPPRNVFCLGRNYADHAAERGAEPPPHPVYFTKPPESVLAPGGGIVHHEATKELDYEVELAAVIGAGGRDIARESALAHVFGYTVINDVTARDLQKRHQQWFKGKSLDTFCPMGPVLVTADEIPDPQALGITLRVNGETRQQSHTSKMIFPVAQCIEVLSAGLTLHPGDVIATGTPEGVGAASGRFLAVGDRVEAEVERIGVLVNTVVAPGRP